MSEVEITCINKDKGNHTNPHEGITHYKWYSHTNQKREKSSRMEMVRYIENGNRAYVSHGSSKAYCYVRTGSSSKKFLQTYADRQYTNNLLALPECE